MEENKTNLRLCIIISTIAIVGMLLVSSVALISMQIQSQNAINGNVKMFELYMNSDYDYGTINQTTDVKVGE